MGSFNDFIERRQRDDWFWIALICLACALIMIDFPLEGVPDGYDLAQHLRFAASYHDAILNGSFIPFWAAGDNLGFGSVGVRFYPPLADYVLAVTQIFTNDWYKSFWLNSVFWMFPGCIGVYLWVKQFRSRAIAAAAAVIYALMPYHLLQVYRLQLYSEFVAASILPFCFLFATRVVKRGRISDVLGLAISCSLILLTHIPTSLAGFAGLGLYSVFIIDWKNPLRSISRFALAIAISIASAAFYLIRLATELSWVRHNTDEFSSGFFDYRHHLFPIFNNFGDGYWDFSLWLLDLSTILILLALLPLPFCALWGSAAKSRSVIESKVLIAVSVTGFFSIFMVSSLSGFIWRASGALQRIQFPWRFLSLAMLMGAVAITLTLSYGRFSRLIIYSSIALVFVTLVFDLTQTVLTAGPLTRERFFEKVVDKRTDEGCACWWPTAARKEAFENTEQVFAENRRIDIARWEPEDRVFTVYDGAPTDVRVATFYYPYWKATVNDRPTEVRMDNNGAIVIPVQAGGARVRLSFEEPYINRIMLYLSSATWLILLLAAILLGFLKLQHRFRPPKES